VWTAPSRRGSRRWEARPGSSLLTPAAVARVHLLYDDHHAGVEHDEEYEAIIHPLDADATGLTAVDHDDRDFLATPPTGSVYRLDGVDRLLGRVLEVLCRAAHRPLTRERAVTIFKNPALKLYSRVEESAPSSRRGAGPKPRTGRTRTSPPSRDKYRTRIRNAQDAIRRAEHRVRELQSEVESRRQTELLSGRRRPPRCDSRWPAGIDGSAGGQVGRTRPNGPRNGSTPPDDRLAMEQRNSSTSRPISPATSTEITGDWDRAASRNRGASRRSRALRRAGRTAEMLWLPCRGFGLPSVRCCRCW
jgi:hypothetical protein